MIHDIALILFLSHPLVLYAGVLGFLFLLFTAIVGMLNFKGIQAIPFRWHPRLAVITIIVIIIHAILGLSIYYNF